MDALLWQEKALSLLDQTKYPGQELWHESTDYRTVAALLKTPAVEGEAILSVAGAYAYCLAALEFSGSDSFYQQLTAAKNEIAAARPNSRALSRALQTLEKTYAEYRNSEELVTALLATAVTIHRQDVVAGRSMGREGRDLIPPQGNIVVSCTGSIFHTGGIGGPLGVLISASRKQGLGRVFVCENRPGMQGRLFAGELLKQNIPVSVIADQSAAGLMPRQSCDMVLLEGLRVAKNGDLTVSPGGYALAITAYFHSIQVYATAYTADIDFTAPDGNSFPLQDGDSRGLNDMIGGTHLPDGAETWAPSYDVIPQYLLTGLMTEKGLVFPNFEESLPEILTKSADKPVLFL